MRALILAAGMAATIVLPPCPAGAQAQPQGQERLTQLELRQRCNRLAIIEGDFPTSKAGNIESQLMRDCMAGKIAAPPLPEDTWQQTYQSCADEGRFGRGISGREGAPTASGRELSNFIEKCINEPGSGSSTASTGTSWGDKRRECTRQGRQNQNLSGNDLTRYVNKCMSH